MYARPIARRDSRRRWPRWGVPRRRRRSSRRRLCFSRRRRRRRRDARETPTDAAGREPARVDDDSARAAVRIAAAANAPPPRASASTTSPRRFSVRSRTPTRTPTTTTSARRMTRATSPLRFFTACISTARTTTAIRGVCPARPRPRFDRCSTRRSGIVSCARARPARRRVGAGWTRGAGREGAGARTRARRARDGEGRLAPRSRRSARPRRTRGGGANEDASRRISRDWWIITTGGVCDRRARGRCRRDSRSARLRIEPSRGWIFSRRATRRRARRRNSRAKIHSRGDCPCPCSSRGREPSSRRGGGNARNEIPRARGYPSRCFDSRRREPPSTASSDARERNYASVASRTRNDFARADKNALARGAAAVASAAAAVGASAAAPTPRSRSRSRRANRTRRRRLGDPRVARRDSPMTAMTATTATRAKMTRARIVVRRLGTCSRRWRARRTSRVSYPTRPIPRCSSTASR